MSFGEVLYTFPQYTPSLMRLLRCREYLSLGCVTCRDENTVRVPHRLSMFGTLLVVSPTYPEQGQRSHCMWFELPMRSAVPRQVFLHEHKQVPLALREECPYV